MEAKVISPRLKSFMKVCVFQYSAENLEKNRGVLLFTSHAVRKISLFAIMPDAYKAYGIMFSLIIAEERTTLLATVAIKL